MSDIYPQGLAAGIIRSCIYKNDKYDPRRSLYKEPKDLYEELYKYFGFTRNQMLVIFPKLCSSDPLTGIRDLKYYDEITK